MKSVMTTQERFTNIEAAQISRSIFDRSFGHKTTLDAGLLYPLYWELAIPGDTFTVKPTIFGRFATPLKPVMDNVFVDMHFFSVPYRLVWDNFQRFMGEQDNPEDTTDYIIPTITSPTEGYPELSIYDYLGIPTKVEALEHSALPLRAANLIWNQWYRDENLQDSLTVPKDDGPDDPDLYALQFRNKRKDYFTSALPWAQKADPVSIPLGGQANVYGHKMTNYNQHHLWQGHDNSTNDFSQVLLTKNASGTTASWGNVNPTPPVNFALGTPEDYEGTSARPPYVTLADATVVTINQFRQAVTLQQFFERDARGGTRYTEIIKSHFNVSSPDARLQRSEYLGGGSTPLTMMPVPQTSSSLTDETPQGNLAAFGTINVNQRGFTKTFTEHEIIIGFVSVRADLNYQQGLNRLWSQSTRFDLFWPTFETLGEQAIKNKELYAQGANAVGNPDEEGFGFAERYAEYKFRPSQITGLFRSNADQSLDLWHLAQEFETPPALNTEFIRENPPISRVVAVPTEPQFILDCYFDNKAARPMKTFAIPGLTRL